MSKIYAIPCTHPACKTGEFYLKYALFEYESKNFHYFLADTKKLVAQIEQDDPKMIEHALWKYKGDSPEGWLEYNSIEHAPDMGSFVFNRYVNFEARLTKWQKVKESIHNALNPNRLSVSEEPEENISALTMNTGQACMLIVAQELDLPFVPIAVHREEGDEENIELLKKLIGYDEEIEPVSYCYDFIKHKPVEISQNYSDTCH